MKKLSICIPTYNRREFLREALLSIPVEFRKRLEVCVSDNASTDGTAEMIQELKTEFPELRYFRWDQNQGADRNYQNCVEIATSEFCFILGSDDRIAAGSLEKIWPHLERHEASIFVLPRLEFFASRPGEGNFLRRWGRIETSRIYDFSNEVDLDSYLDSIDFLGGLFSYLSAFIFRREGWMSYPYDERFHGGLYTHVVQILKMGLAGEKLKYLDIPLAVTRIGNDGFRNPRSLILRSEIDVAGYMKIYDIIISPHASASYRKMLRSELQRIYFNSIAKLVYIKGRSSAADWSRFVTLVSDRGLMFPLLAMEKYFPFWLCRPAASLYVGLRKLRAFA